MFPRRLFCRRWQPKLSKLSQYFFFNLVRELPDSTSYNPFEKAEADLARLFQLHVIVAEMKIVVL
jgi:hypothetical protein